MLIRQGGAPHWSDLWFYGAAPSLAYLGLLGAAAGVWIAPPWAAYAMAAALMILLLVGVRNAWDLVTWLAARRKESEAADAR